MTEFAHWRRELGRRGGSVFLSGGEPLQKPDEAIAIGRVARSLDLRCCMNTNGTLLEPGLVSRILAEGPTEVTVSIDSHQSGIHDWSRGVRGTWALAVEGTKSMLSQRNSGDSAGTRILVNTILYRANYRHLPELVEFLRVLGVDGVNFQPLIRTIAGDLLRDPFYTKEMPDNLDELAEAIRFLKSEHRRDGFVTNSEPSLDAIALYFRSPDWTSEQYCDSGSKNLMISSRGEVKLCFEMRAINQGRSLGNVRSTSMRTLWEGDEAARLRSVMAGCRRGCGILGCHRRAEE